MLKQSEQKSKIIRSEIIKKFGIKLQKSSELFAHIKFLLYLCSDF